MILNFICNIIYFTLIFNFTFSMINNSFDDNSRNIVNSNQGVVSKSFRGLKFGQTQDFGMMDEDDEEEELGNDIHLTPFNMKSETRKGTSSSSFKSKNDLSTSFKTSEGSSSSSSHSSYRSRKSKDKHLVGYTIKEGTGFNEEYNPYKPTTPERAPGKHYNYDLNESFKKKNNECCIIL
ncbi:unnamed protein product [Meloidogyne enterolobii]|uniref:Uncharacterized protein n=2 Tax=Meloidogyne enterolobii TaxID=390850 RepID=A0ACB1B372_MELEN